MKKDKKTYWHYVPQKLDDGIWVVSERYVSEGKEVGITEGGIMAMGDTANELLEDLYRMVEDIERYLKK